MAANFPTSLPAIARVLPTDYMNDVGKEADLLHNEIADEIEALAATVGVTGSAVSGSVEYRLSALDAQIMQSAVSYDSLGRVSTANGWTYSYGASGLIESATTGSITRTYEYDAFGRYTGFTVS